MSPLRHFGKIIVINGTSSAGKSTLAAAVQQSAPELQFLHVQLDAFRAMEPPGYWESERKERGPLRLEALCRAIHTTAAQFARCGEHVLLDHVLTPTACKYLLQDLAGYEVLLVKVLCSIEVLERREAERRDRPLGLAKSQLETVHAGCSYDFELDTTSEEPAQLARRFVEWLRRVPTPSAFQLMQRANAA